MTRPVFILNDVPGCERYPELMRAWSAICHGQEGKRFYFVDYSVTRNTSRWKSQIRARPFLVLDRNWHTWSSHKTLDAAVKAARRLAQPKEKQA